MESIYKKRRFGIPKSKFGTKVKIAGVVLLAGLAFVGYQGWGRWQETTIKSLTEKGASGDQKYLVFTEDGVYQNTDNLFLGKFNSSDVQNKMTGKEGYRARLKVWGWRFGPLSMYENVSKVQILEPDPNYNTGLESKVANPADVPFQGPVAWTPDLIQTLANYQSDNLEVGLLTYVQNGLVTKVTAYDAIRNGNAKEKVQEIAQLVK